MTSTETSQHPTKAQITRLYTLASRGGMNRDAVHDEIFRRYGAESTKELSARQYEQFTAFLEGIIRAQQRDPKSRADSAAHHPKAHNRQGVQQIFREEWPALLTADPALAANLIEALDCFRLLRMSAMISPRVLTAQVQQMKKVPLDALRSAAAIYLERYTSRPEKYFFGIARGEKYRRRRQRRVKERKDEMEARKQRGIERLIEAYIAAAGPFPFPKQQAGCICSRGQIFFRPEEDARFKPIPCPWCSLGIDQLHIALAKGSLGRVDWELVRDQLEEQHAQQ